MPADEPLDWRDAVRWWEWRRITYNAVLTALFVALTIRTWPRLQPELGPDKILPLLVLALLANLCYSFAYLLDPLLSASPDRRIRHRVRLVSRRNPAATAHLKFGSSTRNSPFACDLPFRIPARRLLKCVVLHPSGDVARRP